MVSICIPTTQDSATDACQSDKVWDDTVRPPRRGSNLPALPQDLFILSCEFLVYSQTGRRILKRRDVWSSGPYSHHDRTINLDSLGGDAVKLGKLVQSRNFGLRNRTEIGHDRRPNCRLGWSLEIYG